MLGIVVLVYVGIFVIYRDYVIFFVIVMGYGREEKGKDYLNWLVFV